MENQGTAADVLGGYRIHLENEEKSPATIEKYIRDAGAFLRFAGEEPVTKELVLGYKQSLIERGYAVRSINSMLASLGSFLTFIGCGDCRTKSLKLQRQIFTPEEKELTKNEYLRLLEAARSKPRLYLLLETVCATGIRISELKYFTVESVKNGEVPVDCKGKSRRILLPAKLKRLLLNYAKRAGISGGVIFRTHSGRPMDRSNIWAEMKKLCIPARVDPRKVFPHNLRKLFARTFYRLEKDIARLADILGHSSIDTTRIYIMSTGAEHRRKIERLGLVI